MIPDGDGLTLSDGEANEIVLCVCVVSALRDFFQAERDSACGWWRDPDAPHWIVKENSNKTLTLIDESTGDTWHSRRTIAEAASGTVECHIVARRYYEAHPTPKPWLAAKPRELWIFTAQTGHEAPYRVTESGNFRHAVTGNTINLDRMTEARLLWPATTSGEVTGDE